MAGVALDDLLVTVQEQSGVDFRLYRRDAIERRLLMRMRSVGADTYDAYQKVLEEDPREVGRLIAHLTIKVSHFFRNPDVFDLLREQVIPGLVRRDAVTPLALWCAGCGRGEEAYSLAMLLEEAARAAPHVPAPAQATILATDIDAQALVDAESGVYRDAAVAELPAPLIERYFDRRSGINPTYAVQPDLRRRIIWQQHDLTADVSPRVGMFHLISCRNVVIYLDRLAQERVQHLLTRNLVPGGYLCFGEAEALLPSVRQAYDVVDHRARIYRRKD